MATARERALEAESALLRSELAAMEALVQRYQLELRRAPPTPVRARADSHGDAYRAVDELFENQALSAGSWGTRRRLPAFSDADGRESQFDKVELPSEHWEWVGDWTCDVHARTDEDGWVYAASWQALCDPAQRHRSERAPGDRARRRRWTRERMLVSSTGLPVPVNQRMLEQSRLAAMQYANEKLSQQLIRANDRISEYEERIHNYEKELVRLQDTAKTTPPVSRTSRSSFVDSSFAYSWEKGTDVLRESESLLGELFDSPAMADLSLAITDVQRRRSEMVEECENELKGAVDEFHDLVETLERRASTTKLE